MGEKLKILLGLGSQNFPFFSLQILYSLLPKFPNPSKSGELHGYLDRKREGSSNIVAQAHRHHGEAVDSSML
jgi:hypothetical protein